jgi:hypothetical protein
MRDKTNQHLGICSSNQYQTVISSAEILPMVVEKKQSTDTSQSRDT